MKSRIKIYNAYICSIGGGTWPCRMQPLRTTIRNLSHGAENEPVNVPAWRGPHCPTRQHPALGDRQGGSPGGIAGGRFIDGRPTPRRYASSGGPVCPAAIHRRHFGAAVRCHSARCRGRRTPHQRQGVCSQSRRPPRAAGPGADRRVIERG